MTPTATSTGNGGIDLSIMVSDGKTAILPKGLGLYLLAYANTGSITATNVRITEMVPQAESAQDWTEMLKTQIYLGLTTTTPHQTRRSGADRQECAVEHRRPARATRNGPPNM